MGHAERGYNERVHVYRLFIFCFSNGHQFAFVPVLSHDPLNLTRLRNLLIDSIRERIESNAIKSIGLCVLMNFIEIIFYWILSIYLTDYPFKMRHYAQTHLIA